MSIDTLLEAARYLEWQAQQQQMTREEEQRKEKELINREAESRRVELVTALSQPIRANHVAWGDDSHRQQQHQPPPPPPPPPPSLPPLQVPIAVIPMVPVVKATPSVPPLPLTTQIAVAATSLNGSPPAKNTSSPPQHHQQQHHHQHHQQQQQQQQPPPSPHLLCTHQIKVETSPQLIGAKPSQSQPEIQIQYSTSISTNGSGSLHALVPHQLPPSTQQRPNGVTMEDLRAMEGKRRPGGAGTREVHNKLEKNRRAHLKECFETLKKNVPNVDEKKTSNLSVLRSALRYIQTLKRKEKEYEHEMERLAREKIATQQRLAELKNELSQCMDVIEIDRVLRQTIQPEDDQASTSTASEGEDNFEQDIDEDVLAPPAFASLPKPTPPILQAQPLLNHHLSIQHATLPLSGILTTPSPSAPPHAIAPAPAPGPPPPQQPAHLIQSPAMQVQPTVIAHAAVSHPSVIQAVSHSLPANHKHLTHIAPSPGPISAMPQPIAAAPAAATHQSIAAQPIGHITVHPVAHLGGPLQSHIQTLYPQGVSVSQPTMVGHITHTFTHHTLPHMQANPQANTNGAQMNSAAVISQGSPSLGKPTAVLAPHPQMVGQAAVLNPVTMVTVPTFPVGTLKLS
ncbi:MAX network transcriptional repressor b [Anoplopoma fimbria]|uniref:MAX network transcriptional repressor b n=1 Tax=Anoplopoma fimbria TaxID=229290 RepID=UPI0023ED3700|nr:MAX network transcriptional repressor b [Anoplopoma fimbria]XP_054482519.1 MAX network transcriptional repressor b [Anoplopoma fimbria]